MTGETVIKILYGMDRIKRGQVWCTVCGSTQKVNGETRLKIGWPKCCGYTMTIDSPEEREIGKTNALP